jgi:hypothetical protein
MTNDETGSSNQDCLQVEEDNELREEKEIRYWDGLFAFVILGTCVAWTSLLTMIPTLNIFEHPEFWWENIFPRGLFYAITSVAIPRAWEVYLVFKADILKPKIYPLIFFLAYFLGRNIPYLCIYCVWTLYMGYNFPMPFGSFPCGYIGLVCVYFAVWFLFPPEIRNRPKFKKKLKYFMAYVVLWCTFPYQDMVLDTIFVKAKNYQKEHGVQVELIMAFLIPLFRVIT